MSENLNRNSKSISTFWAWVPFCLFPTVAIAYQSFFPEKWVFMWVLAFAIYISCKWLTLCLTWKRGFSSGILRSCGYLFLAPDMDAKPFMDDAPVVHRPAPVEWITASCKFLLGICMLWLVAPSVYESNPVLGAWVGMFGIILLLHFGSFHLVALAWRAQGIGAVPLMQSPALSTSLSAFWAERWNRGFNQLAHDLVFRVAYRRCGVAVAMLLVFLASGLVHDLVISLPAGGLFGLPTIYFMIQGIGVLIERSKKGRRMGLNRGLRGWVFMFVFTAGPAYWLFHEAFLENVMVPFLKVIHAI